MAVDLELELELEALVAAVQWVVGMAHGIFLVVGIRPELGHLVPGRGLREGEKTEIKKNHREGQRREEEDTHACTQNGYPSKHTETAHRCAFVFFFFFYSKNLPAKLCSI